MIIKIVTISLMAVFYICYFAKMISQKKARHKDRSIREKEKRDLSNL